MRSSLRFAFILTGAFAATLFSAPRGHATFSVPNETSSQRIADESHDPIRLLAGRLASIDLIQTLTTPLAPPQGNVFLQSGGGDACSQPMCESTIIGRPGVGTHDDNGYWSCAFDLAAPAGTPARAIVSGRICGNWGVLDCQTGEDTIFGGRLYLCGDDGNQYYYTHLGKIIALPGQRVEAGDIVGYIWYPGINHLHIAIKTNCFNAECANYENYPRCASFVNFITKGSSCPNRGPGPSDWDIGNIRGNAFCQGAPQRGDDCGGKIVNDPSVEGHTRCRNGQCVVVEGKGVNRCDNDAECVTQHTECQCYQCIVVYEPGVDRCSQDADCNGDPTVATKRACRDIGLGPQCAVVRGEGPDECKNDSDCQ